MCLTVNVKRSFNCLQFWFVIGHMASWRPSVWETCWFAGTANQHSGKKWLLFPQVLSFHSLPSKAWLKKKKIFTYFLIKLLLATPHGFWDPSSLTMDWTRPLAVKTRNPNHQTTRELPLSPDFLWNDSWKLKKCSKRWEMLALAWSFSPI